MKSVRKGRAITQARTRGTTRNLNESIDSDSIASICSEALMFARTAPIPEPTRPASSSPATNGPNFDEEGYCLHGRYHRRGAKHHQGGSCVESHDGSQGEAG